MQKLFLLIFTTVTLLCSCENASNGTSETIVSGVYGVVYADGKPIKDAEVSLRRFSDSVLITSTTSTVNDGEAHYDFPNLLEGEYALEAKLSGYETKTEKILISFNTNKKISISLEKLPNVLRVTDYKGNEIVSLDFGRAKSDITRSFTIFNDGTEDIEWEITNTSEWIAKKVKKNGIITTLEKQAVVIITIDREKLDGGENTTMIHITSNNGSKQLTVTAIGEYKTLPMLNVLKPINPSFSTVTFNGEIKYPGSPNYTERGFVYSMSPDPTLETAIAKLVALLDYSNPIFSKDAIGLTADKTYYVRTYAINPIGVAYSTNYETFVAADVSKCGNMEYNPVIEFCAENKKYTKCADKIYIPSTQYCIGSETIPKCGSTLDIGAQCSNDGVSLLKIKSVTKYFEDVGDHFYTFNTGFPARIEAFAFGSGGGGQGGHTYHYNYVLWTEDVNGTGGAGGGGAAAYMAFTVTAPTSLNISVGKGGAGGTARDVPLTQSVRGYSGYTGGVTKITWGSRILTAGGGHEGIGSGSDLKGGNGGVASLSGYGDIENSSLVNGDNGGDGSPTNLVANNGGKGAILNIGSYGSAGNGGSGGYSKDNNGINGGNGRVVVVVKYPE